MGFAACQSNSAQEEVVSIEQEIMLVIDKFRANMVNLSSAESLIYLDSVLSSDKLRIEERIALFSLQQQAFYANQQYEQALDLVNRELHMLEDLVGVNYLLSQALYRRGDVFTALGQFELAIRNFYRARELEVNDVQACAGGNFSYRMGMIQYRKQDFTEAAVNFKAALKEFDACRKGRFILHRIQEIYSNIGLCHWRLGQHDEAIRWYDSAYFHLNNVPVRGPIDSLHKEVARMVIAGNRGIAVYEKGDKELGLRFIDSAIHHNMFVAKEEIMHACFLAHRTSENLIEEGLYAQAEHYLAIADSVASKMSNSRVAYSQARLLVDLYARTQNNAQLIPALQTYKNLSENIKQQDRRLYEANTELINSVLEQNYLLKAEKAKSEAQSRISHAMFVALFAGISALVIIMYFLSRANNQNKLLKGLNERISMQNLELIKVRERLKRTNTELGSVIDEKDKLLRVVAHDLRNPLAAIYSLSTDVLDRQEMSEELYEIFGLAAAASGDGLGMINELLEKGKQDNNAAKKSLMKLQLDAFVRETVRLTSHHAVEKQMIIEQVCPQELYINADPESLRRALSNLLVNAIKFSHAGSKVIVNCSELEEEILIAVQDFGIGIHEEALVHLFNEKTAMMRPGTAGESSFGLGLSIVKKIVEAHDGRIEVQSAPGKGSRFTIFMPKA